MSRQVRARTSVEAPSYPTVEQPGPLDRSRRRFLRQIALGGGALGVGMRFPLARAQTPEPDFSILSEHVPAGAVSEPETGVRRRARRDEPSSTEEREQAAAPEAGEWITEHRALWVEPAYLLLIEWTRPAVDQAPVAALEGAAESVSALLATEVSDTSQLHDADALHRLETAIVEMLAPMITPAHIDVFHLDHDCNVVCGTAVDPGPGPIVRGRIRSPR